MSAKTKHCIRIPAEAINTFPHGIVHGYDAIGKDLRRKRNVDVVSYGVPGVRDDVLRRLILVSKAPKSELEANGVNVNDLPDLADMLESNMPWAGHVTFNYGSRQFRSKNALSAVSEVLREIDGFVYRLSIDTGVKPETRLPYVFELQAPSRLNPYYKVTVETEPGDKAVSDIILAAPIVPPSLYKELTDQGFIANGQAFNHPCGIKGANIYVSLFGKVAHAT